MPSEYGPNSEEGPPEFTLGTFGDNLRTQRELRGISLEAISTTTKISFRMLRAIEDEHFDQLPGGVFNKGFVRAYARQVGLDEDEAVADYLVALRESQIHSQAILPDFRQHSAAPMPNDSRLAGVSDLPGSLHAEVRAVAPVSNSAEQRSHTSQIAEARPTEEDETADRQTEVVPIEDSQREDLRIEDRRMQERRVDERRNGERRKRADRSSRVLEKVGATFAESLGQPSLGQQTDRHPWIRLAAPLFLITLALAFWNHHRRNQPAAIIPQATSRSMVSASVPAAGKPAASEPVTPPHAAPAPTTHRAATGHPEIHPPERALTVPVPAVNSPSKFTLVIRANQNSSVSIIADGQPVARETLIAPANTSIRAAHEIVVRAGNGAGISFLLNGKEIRGDGTPGEARTYTFDASGLRASAESQRAPLAQ
jgi:hypothetical protein